MRTYRLAPRPMVAAEHWIVQQRSLWQSRLDQLDNVLKDLKEEQR